MKRCPRCGSSTIPESDGVPGHYRPILKCIGCGREILLDPDNPAGEDQLLRQLRQAFAADGADS